MHPDKRGATLIELIITTAIIAIIAAVSSGIIIILIQLFIYLPREMKTKMIAHDVMEVMTEGEPDIRGVRYSVQVVDASSTQFTYSFGYPGNTDKRTVRLEYDSGAKKIYRSYSAFGANLGTGPAAPPYPATKTVVPYYAAGDITITGVLAAPNSVFTYYKQDGLSWTSGFDDLSEIRCVEIAMVVVTGSGSFGDSQRSFQTTSGADVKQYL